MRLLLSAFIAGESAFLFLSEFPEIQYLLGFISLLLSLGFVISWFLKKVFCASWTKTQCICYGTLFFCAGILWAYIWHAQQLKNQLPTDLEEVPIWVEGYIDSMVLSGEGVRRFGFKPFRWSLMRSTIDWQTVKKGEFPTRVSLSWFAPQKRVNQSDSESKIYPFPQLSPGDVWHLPVKLKIPRGQLNPHTFDTETWAYINNFGALGKVIQSDEIFQLPEKHVSFEVLVERLRTYLKIKIESTLGGVAPYAGVLVALVIGEQSAISQSDWAVVNRTGIGHLISISGLHITMLAGIGMVLGKVFWNRFGSTFVLPIQLASLILGCGVAFIYTWIAGFQIPAQRTTWMLMIFGWALYRGRLIAPLDVWLLALWVVLLINPLALLSPGCWLSFGAVAMILYGMGKHEEEFSDVDTLYLRRLKKSFLAATRVQLVVTVGLIPLTAWWFSTVSIVSPLANAFAIPVISFITTPLAISGAFLPSFIGGYLLQAAHFTVEFLMSLLTPMANWSWAAINIAQPSIWRLLVSMSGVCLFLSPGTTKQFIQLRILGLACIGILFVPRFSSLGVGEFQAFVWDIGQGSAVLVETKTKRLMFDTGPKSGKSNDPGQRIILPYLRADGIREIDQLVISHKDSDHIGGVDSLVANMSIKEVMGSFPRNHALYRLFASASIPTKPCQAGNNWQWDGVKFEVFHPSPSASFDPAFHQGKPNEISCVIRVSTATHALWLTGDVEKEGESQIVTRLKASEKLLVENVLMAPHHGSNTSSTPDFLAQIRPQWAFSQSGYKNRYGHPHPKVVSRYETMGVSLLDTSKTGAQVWKFGQDELKIDLYRDVKRKIWHR